MIQSPLCVHVYDVLISDINECEDNNGGCVGGSCQNQPGSYICQCGTGYALYESNEFQGFNIPTSETGEMPGDVYRFNHTCVCEYSPSIYMYMYQRPRDGFNANTSIIRKNFDLEKRNLNRVIELFLLRSCFRTVLT